MILVHRMHFTSSNVMKVTGFNCYNCSGPFSLATDLYNIVRLSFSWRVHNQTVHMIMT